MHLILEPIDRAGPGPRAGGANAQERWNQLGCAERPVTERVASQPARMAVGMAALTAHPAVVREPGVEEQSLPTIGQAKLRPRAQRDRRDLLSPVNVHNRDRVIEHIGDIDNPAIGRDDHRDWTAPHGDSPERVAEFRSDPQLIHPTYCHQQPPFIANHDAGRIAGPLSHISE